MHRKITIKALTLLFLLASFTSFASDGKKNEEPQSKEQYIKDYIQHESFVGVFEYGNQDSFKRELIEMMGLKDAEFSKRSQLSTACSRKFQWNNIAKDVFKIYRSS